VQSPGSRHVENGTDSSGGAVHACLSTARRIATMSEASQSTTKSRPKPAPGPVPGPVGSAFEFPKFEIPNFEMPKLDIPAAFREFAEKGASQAKENYEKMKAAAEEATDVLEDTYATATKGAVDYGRKLIEATRLNTNAAFDFYTGLMNVKSYSDVIELSTAHARKQFEAVTAQTKDLAALAQKVATETAEPIKDSVTKAFSKVA
jgi:phasin